MKTLGNNKSKDKGRPKSHCDQGKQKSMENVEYEDIATFEDSNNILVSKSSREEYNEFIIDPGVLKSENVPPLVPRQKPRIPVKVQKVVPSSKTQKVKPKQKVLVARTLPSKARSLAKVEPKESGEEFIKPHSIIGSIGEYRRMKTSQKNHVTEHSKIIMHSEEPLIPPYEEEFVTSPADLKDDTVHIDEKNALKNWSNQMNERQKQQEYLSRCMAVSGEMLLMNQGDLYRTIQEERTLIDRSMPSKDYGKGYRVGSEFWKQTETLGCDAEVNITLSKTEKGNVPSIEHVGYPSSIKKEMGTDWKMTHRMKYIHYPWWKSEYLHERKHHLQNVIDELDPHKFNPNELEIIGKSIDIDDKTELESDIVEIYGEEIQDDCDASVIQDVLADYDDVIPQPFFGPSLLIDGHSASWQDDSDSNLGVSIRLLFSVEICGTGNKIMQIRNNGTTVIHYLWKKIPQYNPFEINKGRPLKRFFFNVSNGVILPGDCVDIPFVFKSPNAGIFSEIWQLETLPVVCGKENILITLNGIATENDEFENERKQLEKHLQDKQNKVMAGRILNAILASIKTPERPSTPDDNYITEDEIFNIKNENLHFKMESIAKLKKFHAEFNPDSEWDLSLNSLISNVTFVEEEEDKEAAFQRVNADIKELNFPNAQPISNSKYDSCYLVLCDTFDKFSLRAQKLNVTFGIAEKELVIKSSEMSGRKSKKAGDVEGPTNKSRIDTRTAKKDAGVKSKTPKEKGKRENTSVRSAESEGEGSSEVVEKPVNVNYLEKLYIEIYDCLSEMAINIEAVLTC